MWDGCVVAVGRVEDPRNVFFVWMGPSPEICCFRVMWLKLERQCVGGGEGAIVVPQNAVL